MALITQTLAQSNGIIPNTDLSVGASLKALVAAAPGKILLGKGTYIVDLTELGSYIDGPSGTSIEGEGNGTLLLLRGASGTRPLFRCFADTFRIDNLKIQVDSANAGTTTFFIFQPGGGGRNLLIGPGVEIDGAKAEDGSSPWTVHVVAPDGSSNFQGIWFEGYWHHVNRAWLKTNTDTGEQNMLRFTNKLYLNKMLAEPIALNTPSGRVYDVIMEHTSRDLLAASSAHVAIGSSEGVLCSAKVYGSGKRAFHLEEGVRRARLIGAYCEMTDADAIGLFMTDNNIHLATQPIDVTVLGSQFKGPGKTSVGSVGWQATNDSTTRGPANGMIFNDNLVEDWERGATVDNLLLNAMVERNLFRRTGKGFHTDVLANDVGVNLKDRFNRNRFDDVTVPFENGSTAEVFWGSGNRAGFSEFMGAPLWVTGTRYKVGDQVSNLGLKYEANTAHTAGATFSGDSAYWTLVDRWTNGLGSDGTQSVVHNTSLVRLKTGATASTNFAINGVRRGVTTPYLIPALAPIRIGARVKVDAITSVAIGFGLTDDGTTFEQPIGIDSTTTQVNAAADACVLWISTGISVLNWQGLAVKGGVSNASKVDSGAIFVAATYQYLEVALDTSGNAIFYIDGSSVGTLANAVTPTVPLSPVLYGKNRGSAARLIDSECTHVQWGA